MNYTLKEIKKRRISLSAKNKKLLNKAKKNKLILKTGLLNINKINKIKNKWKKEMRELDGLELLAKKGLLKE